MTQHDKQKLPQLPDDLSSLGNLKICIAENTAGGTDQDVNIVADAVGLAKEAGGNLAAIKSNTDKLDVNQSTRASESTLSSVKAKTDNIDTPLSGIKSKTDNIDIAISALRDALRGASNKTLTDVVTALANLSNLDVAASTLAKESGGNLATIAAKDFATQTTLALIKAKTDNMDAALSTLATQATLALIKAKTDNLDTLLSNLLANSKFPATAALQDGTTNPTLTQIGIFNHNFNGNNWDRARNYVSTRQVSGVNTQLQITLSLYETTQLVIYLVKSSGNLSGTWTIECSADGSNYFTADSISLPAATTTLKQYDMTHLATTVAINPAAYPFVRITIPGQSGQTVTAHVSAK